LPRQDFPLGPRHTGLLSGDRHHRVDVIARERRWLSSDRRTQPTQLSLDGFPEVLEQVKPIRDLARLWRSLPRTFREIRKSLELWKIGVRYGEGFRMPSGVGKPPKHEPAGLR
jgi:hypothetical protein